MSDVVRRPANKARRFSGSWNTLSTLFKRGVWHVAHMSEGRRSQVVLLDERRLDIVIQSRLYAGELLDIVASHFNIKEKEYFGIAFIDDNGLLSWLQLSKRVLEHDFPKKFSSQGAVLIFYFRIKYFVESITQLHDSATIEAYYLQAKSLVAKGELHIDSEIIFQLAALVIQATYGDFLDETTFKINLKRLSVLPATTLKEYPTIPICESKVLEHYKSLQGQTRGEAIVNYLSILESLPAYGQHYYEVKDKSGSSCLLSLSYRGISEYDKNDRTVPRRVFLWKQLENLYYRDRKFTVEVHEARRVVHTLSSFNLYEDAIEEPVEEFDDLSSAICDPTTQVSVSRRALAPASVTVYVWYATSATSAKCIWSMAIAQHGFFIDRSNKKSRSCANRNLSQIATELCRSVQSLSSASSLSNISRSTSSASIPTIAVEGEISEESKAATIEMLTALQSRKDALQESLKKKTDELKALCLKEAELTGELPPETPFQPGEPQPQVRRRVGTSFTLNDKIICRAKGKDRESLNDLELDYEIQSKIASAALKLANEVSARKSVRKLRKISYQQATTKLKDIEQKISTLKREKEAKKKPLDTASEGTPEDIRAKNHLGLPSSSSENSIADRSGNSLTSGSVPPSTSLPHLSEAACSSAPPSPAKCRQRHQSLQHVPVITTDVYEDVGLPTTLYNPHSKRNSSSYSANSEYDTVSYNGSTIGSLGVLYRNRFEANIDLDGTNHYSVPNRRASQAFNDPDESLLNGSANAVGLCYPEDAQSSLYVNSASLSSSYDDRLAHKTGFAVVPETVSNADSYDKSSIGSNSILSFNDSTYQLNANCDLSKQEKYFHSHSENSLHRQRANSLLHKLEHLHISEPELNIEGNKYDNNNSLGCNVPLLKNTLRPTSTILPASTSDYSSGVSSQSINQVIDLGLAPAFQEFKRTGASGTLEYTSSKPKTKEWIETSLDSPIVTRRRKAKHSDGSLPNETCQQVQWLENGLPAVFPNGPSYSGYPSQPKYEDNSSNSVKFRKTPSPIPHQYNSDAHPEFRNAKISYPSPSPDTHSEFRNTKISYPSQSSGERIYVNSNVLQNSSGYHDYENTPELPKNLPKFIPRHSSPCYENMPGNINSDYNKKTHEDQKNQLPVISREEATIPKLGIAEPQQPSKYQNRRINMADVFVPDTIRCNNDPDYQNIPIDNQYELVNFGENNSQYAQLKCDVSDSNHFSHNHSFQNESQSVYTDNLKNTSSETPQVVPTWQHSTTPVQLEAAPLSPVSQNFSPNVEVNVVSLGHFQPYWEETKPYELSDFYKYSTKHRKQQKNSTSDSADAQSHVEKETSCVNYQYYEQTHINNMNTTYREMKFPNDDNHASSVLTPPKQHQEIITSHVPVFGCSEQLESPAQYYSENSVSSPAQQSDPDKSLSLGDVGLRISLADTFHDEMVAWYQNQDTVKKATLV